MHTLQLTFLHEYPTYYVSAHMLSRHKKAPPGLRVFKCDHCDYMCMDKHRHEEHLASHSGQCACRIQAEMTLTICIVEFHLWNSGLLVLFIADSITCLHGLHMLINHTVPYLYLNLMNLGQAKLGSSTAIIISSKANCPFYLPLCPEYFYATNLDATCVQHFTLIHHLSLPSLPVRV